MIADPRMAMRELLHEALEHSNVRAFLRALRLGEGTADALGYRRLVGGGEFDSFAAHPRILVKLPRLGISSTAAGAFQLIHPTWSSLAQRYGFTDFSPSSQDEAAVALIRERQALVDVREGRIDLAIAKCAPVWASLPGSAAGQRIESLAAIVDVYRDYGGQLA